MTPQDPQRFTGLTATLAAASLLIAGSLLADNSKKPVASAPSKPAASAPKPSAPVARPTPGGGHTGGATGGAHSASNTINGAHNTGNAAGAGARNAGAMAGGARPAGGTGNTGGAHNPGTAGAHNPAGAGSAGTHNPGSAGNAGSHNPGGVGNAGTHNPGGVGNAGSHNPGGVGNAGTHNPGGVGNTGRAGSAGVGGGNAGNHRMPGASQHAPGNPGAGRVVQHANGGAMVRGNGNVSVVQGRNGMTIRRAGSPGMRRAVVERNGRVYSFNRAGYGHIRSGFAYGGHQYAVRRYYVGGAYYPRYYSSYAYHGVFLDAYAPSYFYSPYYYGWAYRPWAAPVVFSWGWGGSPWYGYYGGYFRPYPSYAAANLWLTDYIAAQTLEAAYRERVESARAAQMQYSDQPPQQVAQLTPEIKQMIAEEVQRQLAIESAEAAARNPVAGAAPSAPPDPSFAGVGRMVEDGKVHVLLSSSNIDVTTQTGQECAITQGDAIGIYPGQAVSQDNTLSVRVLASAGGGCPANSVVAVSIEDLQEMMNHVRATIDAGLAVMAKDPKLPRPPAGVSTATTASEFVSAAPPADPNEAAELQRLNNEATQTEASVVKDASFTTPQTGGGVTSASQTTRMELQLGMTPDQVIQAWGAPKSNVKMGTKQILSYPDVKLVFDNGRLAEMQ